MTTKALELLTADHKGRPGFFLQVEGASIDKQDHAENPCQQQIGETIAFDDAVRAGLKFAEEHPDTDLFHTMARALGLQ